MAFYYSPFECTFQESKQTVVDCSYLRVIGGAQYPSESIYSQVRAGACFPKYDVLPQILRRHPASRKSGRSYRFTCHGYTC